MQGFAELEYGILRWMGAIDDSTLVVTTGTVAHQYHSSATSGSFVDLTALESLVEL